MYCISSDDRVKIFGEDHAVVFESDYSLYKQFKQLHRNSSDNKYKKIIEDYTSEIKLKKINQECEDCFRLEYIINKQEFLIVKN